MQPAIVPAMETNAHPTHLSNLLGYINIPYTNHFISVSPYVELGPSLLPAELDPNADVITPVRGTTPSEMNQFQCGFRHLIGIEVLHPYFKS